MIIEGIVRGDTINLECTIADTITDWKIRAEIFDDCGNSVKLATVNSGGSDDQIEITNDLKGDFTIKIAKNLTTNFNSKTSIEVEVENASGEITTPLAGEENFIIFKNERITWTSPDD